MAYNSKNARRGVILLSSAHLLAMSACEPEPVELSSFSVSAVEIPSVPEVAPERALIIEAPKVEAPKVDAPIAPRRRQSVKSKPETSAPSFEPPPEYAAPPERTLALEPVWAIPGAMPSQAAPTPAPTRVAARKYDPHPLFGCDVRVERPRRGWPFLPRPEGPRTARLAEVDVPMEVNIPLPRLRGPMIDVVEFDVSGQHRPRVTFKVHQESGTAPVERQCSKGAPK